MFSRSILTAVFLACLCASAGYAQEPASVTAGSTVEVDQKQAEAAKKLRDDAIVFLRETMADTANLRTLENRISFASEMAGMMWFADEREARAMYAAAINDFRQLVLQYDAQLNAMGPAEGETEGFGGFLAMGSSDRQRLMQRFTMAMSVRQLIAASVAEHDPDMAFNFYHDSLGAVSNPEMLKQLATRDTYFETQLIDQIAEKNASKATELGKKSLASGVTYQHVEMLKKIHKKDPEKGAEFASAMISKLKSDTIMPVNFYAVDALIDLGEEYLDASKKPGGKKAPMTEADLRDVADLFGKAILDAGDEEEFGINYLNTIAKYAPGRATQIRTKYRIGNDATGSKTVHGYGMSNSVSNAVISSPASNSSANSAAAREESEKRMMEDMMKVGTKQLPKEERERVIAQARRILMQTPGRDKKIAGLSLLAAQIAKAGDKELANEIMRDAESLVNPYPKNYEDFLLTWMLATGYASADPDRAFAVLEDTITRANETIAAFIKVGEFVDVAEGMIKDGEVQVGAFGGGMVRGLTSQLGMAESTIGVLAKADFEKTKNLTNRFDRPEVRILAKMMVLRTVLETKEKPMDSDELGAVEGL